MSQITPARKLFDLLVSRDFDPEILDSSGKPAADPGEAEIFSFDFRAESGQDYGTVVIMLGEDNNLDVYCADNVGKTMAGEDKDNWFGFLQQLKQFAVKNFMSFGIKNLNRLRYSMQGQAAIKEGLFESWQGKKDISWNAGPTESRLVIKHKRVLDENEARFRCVDHLFIETAEGERYRLPFRNLTAGRAMLEHVRAGGRPYDLRGQHISEMVTELGVLNRFKRANHGRLLEGDTAALVEQTTTYTETLKHTLKSLTTRTGYANYFESWTPAELSEESVVIEGLKHLFITQSIDQRIEEALPLIARIQQQENAMKEANIFEAWADRLMEGTWATPDTPEKQAQLVQLMSAELPVGADATNATEQLYDLIGDDELFDRLQALADQDANADARQTIYDRMQELANDPDIAEVMTQFTMDMETPAGPAEPVAEIKDPVDQTEDPADTEQPKYPEYQDDLASILKNAGVDDTVVRAAPDYEDEITDEGALGTVGGAMGGGLAGTLAGGALGAAVGGPAGAVLGAEAGRTIGTAAGAVGGQELTKGGSGVIEADEEETDEGVLGTAIGAVLGGIPAGLGGALAGGGAGYLLSKDKEETDENVKGSSTPIIKQLLEPFAKGLAPQGGPGPGSLTNIPISEKDDEATDEGLGGAFLGGLTTGSALGTAGGIAGTALGGPIGGAIGAATGLYGGAVAGGDAGHKLTKGGSPVIERDDLQQELDEMLAEFNIDEEINEGWKGQLAGGTAGSIGGGLAGTALGGPIGGMFGGALGGTAGQMIGDKLGGKEEEQLNEVGPAIAAGARLLIPMLSRIGPVLGRAASGAGKAGADVAGKTAAGVGRGTVELGKSAAQSAAKNAVPIGIGAGAYQAITDVATGLVGGVGEVYNDAGTAASALAKMVGNSLDNATIESLALAAVKYAIPIGILIAVLYGGKKLIDKIFSESAIDEGRCNMTEAGEMCPTHGLKECGMEESWGLSPIPTAESPLKGQYGHSGKMKAVAEDTSFLDRLKELSGLKR